MCLEEPQIICKCIKFYTFTKSTHPTFQDCRDRTVLNQSGCPHVCENFPQTYTFQENCAAVQIHWRQSVKFAHKNCKTCFVGTVPNSKLPPTQKKVGGIGLKMPFLNTSFLFLTFLSCTWKNVPNYTLLICYLFIIFLLVFCLVYKLVGKKSHSNTVCTLYNVH